MAWNRSARGKKVVEARKKKHMISVRMDDEQLETFSNLIARSGFRTRADYMIARLLLEENAPVQAPAREIPELGKQILTQVLGAGNLLNQIARALNMALRGHGLTNQDVVKALGLYADACRDLATVTQWVRGDKE
jgi:hypothetical protein